MKWYWSWKDLVALEQNLWEEFSSPEKVVAEETTRRHREALDRLTGMPEEQAEWETTNEEKT